ncbi:hypothetical protein V6N00_00540 [Tersicoccus sp. MR15.9]|uniref:hypothetical protein n=1 Tax=Tersicoccus mangrovi TaxID=3121635 RepID=UPI002FE5B47F
MTDCGNRRNPPGAFDGCWSAGLPPQVIGWPHNVVNASGLSRDAVLAGIKAGRSWIAESADIDLALTARSGGRTAGVGERLPVADDAPVTVSLTVSGVPNGVIRLITDEGQMQQVSLPASGEGSATWVTTPQLAAYVRAEVRHPMADGTASNGTAMGETLLLGHMAALTNPVFLGRR